VEEAAEPVLRVEARAQFLLGQGASLARPREVCLLRVGLALQVAEVQDEL
jgi:hypothetical protein